MEHHESLIQWVESNQDNLDALVFDIDGVLIWGAKLLPGALELIDYLRSTGIMFGLLTNDGSCTNVEKAGRLNSLGMTVDAQEVVSAGNGLINHVSDEKLAGELFFVMGGLGNPDYGEEAGLLITKDLAELENTRGVIISENPFTWETTINSVVNYFIKYPDRMFIVPNPDEFFPGFGQKIIIGPGGLARFIVKMLDHLSVKLEPVYLGKPYKPIFAHCHDRLENRCGKKLNPHRIVMVGDYLESDVRGAINFGYKSALMMTGLTNRKMLDASDVKPDFVFDRL